MGSSESSPEVQGWRILEVLPNGPCSDKGLCVYFDFIVGVNGVRLTTSSEEFWDTITNKKDVEIVMTVFNYKTRVKRDILMTPNNNWGGDGLLGLVVVRDDFTKCDQQAVRVLKVHEDSPAFKAGLQAQTDYILGTPIAAFTEFSIFRDTVADYMDQALPIYVYNSEQATVRMVEIVPSSKWPGEGVLGCITGDGYLHQIPSLMEDQETITFVPNSCYVISSRSPRQISEDATTSSEAVRSDVRSPLSSSTGTQETQQTVPQKHQSIQQHPMNEVKGTNLMAQSADSVASNISNPKSIEQGQNVENNEVKGDVDEMAPHQEEEADLPSMVRWTDSSNKLNVVDTEDTPAEAGQPSMEQEPITQQQGMVPLTADTVTGPVPQEYEPVHGGYLLHRLEAETQQVLAQQ